MRYYEDLKPGEERVSGTRTVSADEIVAFARQYDAQYFHADLDAARASVFGEVVASGVHIIALWRQLDHESAPDVAWICGVGWDEVRFRALRGGDTVRARSRCVDKRPSASRPERGVVVYEYRLENQRGEPVFRCLSTNLVQRRSIAQAAGAAPDVVRP